MKKKDYNLRAHFLGPIIGVSTFLILAFILDQLKDKEHEVGTSVGSNFLMLVIGISGLLSIGYVFQFVVLFPLFLTRARKDKLNKTLLLSTGIGFVAVFTTLILVFVSLGSDRSIRLSNIFWVVLALSSYIIPNLWTYYNFYVKGLKHLDGTNNAEPPNAEKQT